MSSKVTIWASDDGSYGTDAIYTAVADSWSKKQWNWFHELANTDEVYAYELMDIDNGIMPDRIEEEE